MTYRCEKADAMRIHMDYNNMMAENIGKNGICEDELAKMAEKSAECIYAMEK